MNITINTCNPNTNFQGRYLRLYNEELFPQIVKDAIYRSDAIDTFLHSGKKKGFLAKLIDFFRKDEALEIEYVKNSDKMMKKHKFDDFESYASLCFKFGRNLKKYDSDCRFFEITESQHGIPNNKIGKGIIVKKTENPYYDKPTVTVEEKIAQKVNDIENLDKELKKLSDIE